jgi:hypothetical protein
MKDDRYKVVEIEGGQYTFCKFDALTALKVARLLITKITAAGLPQAGGQESTGDFDVFARLLSDVKDEDLDYLVKTALKFCSKMFPAGNTPVINLNGSFAVPEVEQDVFLMLRLTMETILWSMSDFFDEGRWNLPPGAESLLSRFTPSM